MQNRYAADIGDFGKFHLLRYLFTQSSYNLKQIWYMYPDESHNSDGMYIDYFEKVEGQDRVLEETFKTIIKNTRSVKALENANLILNCNYYSSFVNKNGKDDLAFRKTWLKEALEFSKKADFIFVDPDNGIATKLVEQENIKDIEILGFNSFSKKSKAGKYIFLDEIELFYDLGKGVVVYHHLNRTMAHDKQIELLKSKLEERFFKVLAIKHKPYSPRVYFFILKEIETYEFCLKNLSSFEKEFSHHWQLFL